MIRTRLLKRWKAYPHFSLWSKYEQSFNYHLWSTNHQPCHTRFIWTSRKKVQQIMHYKLGDVQTWRGFSFVILIASTFGLRIDLCVLEVGYSLKKVTATILNFLWKKNNIYSVIKVSRGRKRWHRVQYLNVYTIEIYLSTSDFSIFCHWLNEKCWIMLVWTNFQLADSLRKKVIWEIISFPREHGEEGSEWLFTLLYEEFCCLYWHLAFKLFFASISIGVHFWWIIIFSLC